MYFEEKTPGMVLVSHGQKHQGCRLVLVVVIAAFISHNNLLAARDSIVAENSIGCCPLKGSKLFLVKRLYTSSTTKFSQA